MRELHPVSSRHIISKSEKKRMLREIGERLPRSIKLLGEARRLEIAKLRSGGRLILVEGVPAIFLGEYAYPTLLAAHKLGLKLPLVIVDMGAVPHILNGADVMAPGIVEFEEFEEGEIVYVADEEGKRVFAVGLTLVCSAKLREMKRGKVIKNLHYAGDKLWEVIRTIF